MSLGENFLKKMKMISEEEDYDDYDEYDDFDEDEEEKKEEPKKSLFRRTERKSVFRDEPEEEEASPESPYSIPTGKSSRAALSKPSGKGSEVCMIVPKGFEDANAIADVLLSHKAVVLNLETVDMAAAQRIIDFASGSCYTLGGNLQKISKKIFIVAPADMNLSGDFRDLLGSIDLNSVNMMK